MKICKCDRCGKEIDIRGCVLESQTPDYWKLQLTAGNGLNINLYDLCSNCAQVIFDTINNFKKEEN